MARKVMVWLGIAFVIWFIAYQPRGAADVVGSTAGTIGEVARGFGEFFTRLAA